jgi:benzylsuccinate CoA-transferase BbsE subunit
VPDTPAALAGFRVLELGHPATAYGGKLLADLGADVVKVEPPEGSPERRLGPFHGDLPHPERGLPHLFLNANKRGVTLALGTADGRVLFRRLLATADVLLEALPPGRLAAWGLDYATLAAERPGLVLASISGFGQDGPYRDYLAPDFIAFAVGGLMFLSGEPHAPPVAAPCQQAYLVGSLHAALAVLIALWGRRRGGRGEYIDVSLQACLNAQENLFANYFGPDNFARRTGSQHRLATPGRVYPCADGFVYMFVSPGTDHWRRLLDWLGHPAELDDPVFQHVLTRRREAARVDTVMRRFTATRTRTQLYAEGQSFRIPVAPVYAPGEAAESEHFEARGFLRTIEHPLLGLLRLPGAPYHLGASPWALRRPPPLLGQHNAAIYGDELGLSTAEQTALREIGAI